jgi:hypothetical protein
MEAPSKSKILSTLWSDIQAFLASNPQPNDYKILSHGNIRHSMSMPRYFFDQAIRFDGPTMERVNKLAERYRLRLDVREDPDGKEQGNFVMFDEAGNYYGRITTQGLTLTPQRFGEAFIFDILSLYLTPEA